MATPAAARSPAPLSFAVSDFLYVQERVFGNGSLFMKTTFLQPVYLPYPQRMSLFRTLSWVLQQSPEILAILERGVDVREQQDIERAFRGENSGGSGGDASSESENLAAEELKREIFKQKDSAIPSVFSTASSSSSSSFLSHSGPPLPVGAFLRSRVQTIYTKWTQSSPYIVVELQDRRLISLLYQEIIVHIHEWMPNYTNEQELRMITELEVKNKYEDLRQKRQGLHHYWLELDLHHPLDVFANLFLYNEVRRDVRIFLLLAFFQTVEMYNHHGTGSPPYLDPMTTLSMLMDQLKVVFPARVEVLLPRNALFCEIFQEHVFKKCMRDFHNLVCSDPAILHRSQELRRQEKMDYLDFLQLPQVVSYPCSLYAKVENVFLLFVKHVSEFSIYANCDYCLCI